MAPAMSGWVIQALFAFGTFETCRLRRAMSEFEGKAENLCSH
jgi:hypothetical protein